MTEICGCSLRAKYNMSLIVNSAPRVSASRCHLQHHGVKFIPEGFVTELAGVRQTRTSFLLAASGHAKVTASIGHL